MAGGCRGLAQKGAAERCGDPGRRDLHGRCKGHRAVRDEARDESVLAAGGGLIGRPCKLPSQTSLRWLSEAVAPSD